MKESSLKAVQPPLVSMGFNFAIEEAELRETIDAWNTYIDRLSKNEGHDSQMQHLVTSARLRRGIAYATLKEWDAAIADFQWMIDEQRGIEEVRSARMMLGAIYTELVQDEQAIECWTAVLTEYEQASRKEAKRYAEQFPQLYLYRGMLYGRLEQYQEAIADCDRAEKYVQDSAEVYSVRGISYAYLGNLDHALADCLHAVELEQQASCYNRLGEVYFMCKDYQQSLAAFDRAVELDPTDELFRANRNKALCSTIMSLFECDDAAGQSIGGSEISAAEEEQAEVFVGQTS